MRDRKDDSLTALRRILRATEQHERTLAQATGLTPAQLRVLQIVVATGPDGTTPTALATQMGVSQATITALVDKLSARGLVARQRSRIDRRQTYVMCTASGTDAVAQSPDALQQRFSNAFDQLEDWEQSLLVASLQRVASMLDDESVEPIAIDRAS